MSLLFDDFPAAFDTALADSLKSKLNAYLSHADLPDFIGPIAVESLHFGSEPPEIVIQDITNPDDLFYAQHIEEDDSSKDLNGWGYPDGSDGSQSSFENILPKNNTIVPDDSVSHAGYTAPEIISAPLVVPLKEKNEADFQVTLTFQYKGNAFLKLGTEMIINKPLPNFMSLPVHLTLSAIHIEGTFCPFGA